MVLATEEMAEIHLSQIDPESPIAEEVITLTRSSLDQVCEDLVRRSFVICDQVLRDAELRPSDIDTIFLAGGSTHLPIIQQGVEIYFGCAGHKEIEPTEVVARGARISAGSVLG